MNEDSEQTKPLCVVLDTNIWVKNPLLRDPLGAALLFAIRQMNGYIGLPEIVEQEIIKNVARTGHQAVESIHAAYRTVLILTGAADDYRVPSEADFESSAIKRLDELQPLIKRVPFTLEHAKSALKRVNDESPPNNSKNQQFKDSAIWEAVLQLSESFAVHLGTEDKGFFEGRDYRGGLAKVLRDDCEARERCVFVYPDLKSLLSALRETVPALETAALAQTISDAIRSEVTNFGLSKDYGISGMRAFSISPFLTERSEVLAIGFEITYEALDLMDSSSDWTDYVKAKGDCLYSLSEKTVTNPRIGSIEYRKSSGETVGPKGQTTIFGVGGITLGRKQKTYSLKTPLP
jgi:PIN domain